MVSFAHISDIHFGAVDLAAADKLAEAIEAVGVDAVIVTGDLTQAGRRNEFKEAAAYLEKFTAPTLAVPGNHDAPVYSAGERMVDPWRRYRKYINDDVNPVLSIEGAAIIGLKSARRANISMDWSRGRLSKDQIAFAAKELTKIDEDALRLVAFHHPVTPGQGVAGNALINAPEKAIAAFAEAGADFILTGHVHQAKAELHEAASRALIIAAAGTASSTRTRGEAPSFNIIRGDRKLVEVEIWRYEPACYAIEKTHAFARRDGAWTHL